MRPFTPLMVTVALAATLSFDGAGAADPPGRSADGPAIATDRRDAAIVSPDLVPEPLTIESLGLSIHPPRAARHELEAVGEDLHLVMVDRATPPRWRIRVQPLESRIATPTPRTVVQDHINRLNAVGQPYEVLANDPVRYGGVNGHLLVIEERAPDGTDVVNGWIVLSRGGLNFTVVTLNTDRSGLLSARSLLEATLASLTLTDAESLRQLRRARLDAGAEIVRHLTPERLRSLVGHDQWHRIHRPADGSVPEIELGSVRVRAASAARGSVHADRNPDRYTAPEREEGLLVTVTARLFLSEDGSHRMDVEQRYWMAWDRTIETWSSRTLTVDQGRQRASSQTGIREPIRPGHPTSRLTVINDVQASPGAIAPLQWTIPEATYVSQPEIILFGELLAHIAPALANTPDAPSPLDGPFALHYFDPRRDRLPQRIDRWRRLDGPGPGAWELTTTPALDEPAIVQIHDDRGRRLKRIEADGSVVERIELRTLREIWRRKGLPLS